MQSIDYLPILPREISRMIFEALVSPFNGTNIARVELISKSWADIFNHFRAHAANQGASLANLGFCIKSGVAFVKRRNLTCAVFTFFSSSIRDFMVEISTLSNLQKFHANCIDQKSLEHIGKLENLRELYLKCEKIQSLASIAGLTQLETLEISSFGGRSRLKDDTIPIQCKLQKLSLSYFQIDIWPEKPANLLSLKLLSCSINGEMNLHVLTHLQEL